MVFRSSLESWLSLPHHIEPVSLLRYSLVLIVNAVRDFRGKYNVSLPDFQAIEFGLLPECFEKQFKGMIYTIRMPKNGRMLNLFRLNLNFARSRPATENPTPVTTFWRYLRLSYLELCYKTICCGYIENIRFEIHLRLILFEFNHTEFLTSHWSYLLNTTLQVHGVGFSVAGLDRAKLLSSKWYRFY